MTWKRELAFWIFMFVVAIWFPAAIVWTGKFITDNWGASVAIERAK